MPEYPADLPGGESTGTLLGTKVIQVFPGDYGADGLDAIDRFDEPHFRYLEDGRPEPVMERKMKHGNMNADEYRDHYEIGYPTNIEHILIDGDTVTFHKNTVTFHKNGEPLEARYASHGYEILTYETGNRGVRFIVEKVEGDDDAPQYIQFRDRRIPPVAAIWPVFRGLQSIPQLLQGV
ncbi:ZinT/AdcA family metal-binding protein [Paracoccus onubensis]|nr:ZinT/AdcA family metal-binding protein [Paracoccus onubensis]